MTSQYLARFLLLVLFVISCYKPTFAGNCAEHFQEEPQDMNVTKGGELFLRCSIVNLGKNLVSWLFNGLPINYTDQRYSLVKGQSHLRVKNVSEADTGPYACSVGYPNWSSCPPLTSPDAQVRVLDNGGLNSKKKEGRSLDDEIHDFDPKPGTEADVSPPSSGVESEAAGASSGNRSDDYLLTIIVPVIIALLNAGVPDFINRCRRSCQPGLEETGWPNPQTRSV